jgi:hypothetical protein
VTDEMDEQRNGTQDIQEKYGILGSQNGEDVFGGLRGCDAVTICWWVPTFRRNILPPSATNLRIEQSRFYSPI